MGSVLSALYKKPLNEGYLQFLKPPAQSKSGLPVGLKGVIEVTYQKQTKNKKPQWITVTTEHMKSI